MCHAIGWEMGAALRRTVLVRVPDRASVYRSLQALKCARFLFAAAMRPLLTQTASYFPRPIFNHESPHRNQTGVPEVLK
jgi:hypothetical protein